MVNTLLKINRPPGDTVIVDGTSTTIITPNETLHPDESFVKFPRTEQYVSKRLLADEYFVNGRQS